ncbi:MAG: PAS domain S-box protein [Planctomycetota bacterium]|nr:PAS domain S-box protein [Planctomycetota bacterium]
MVTLLAIDALNDRVPVFEADRYPADLMARERSSRTTHVAVVDGSQRGRFLGLLGLRDLMERRRGGELIFGDLVARKNTLRVEPHTPLREVVDRLTRHKHDAAAVVNQAGEYLGAVTIDEARQRLEARRAELQASSERHFRAIFEQAAVGVCQVGLNGRCLDVNPRLCSITGFTRDELLATTLEAFTHSDDVAAGTDGMRRLVDGSIAEHVAEQRLVRSDGSFIWTNLSLSLVRDAEVPGDAQYFIAVVEDIDARKQAQAAAAEAAASLGLAVKASNIGLWDWDLNTNQIRFSPEWKGQLGYAHHEVADDIAEWKRLVHPDDFAMKLAEDERYLADPNLPHEIEFRMRHKDGSWRWIYSRGEVTPGTRGKPARMLGCHVDITESKRLTEAVHASAAFLRGTVDAIPARTAVVDSAGTIVIVNQQWRSFAAAHPDDPSATSDGANYLAACDDAEPACPHATAIASALRSVLAGAADPLPIEYPHRCEDHPQWFQACIHGFNQGTGRFAVITHQDVTAARLAAIREAAHTQRQAVATIAAGVAHEFNSLLMAASMQIDRQTPVAPMVSTPPRPAAKATELIQQAQRLAAALLDLYAGPEEVGTRPMTLYPWLTETVATLASALPPGIHVAADVEFDLPEAMGHALGLEQVLRNLLINAANVLGDRGDIHVHAKSATIDGQPMVEIRVSDTGPGVPEALRSRVFEPRFTTVARSYRSGLGLAIAARLLDQFGGSIHYEPNSPIGSTFVVRLRAHAGELL